MQSLGNLIPAKKGDVRNPLGKKKGTLSRKTLAMRWLTVNEDAQNPITGQLQQLSQADIITLAQILAAKKGDTAAYKALMENAFGAPKQEIEQTIITEKQPSEMDNGELAREVARILKQENDGTGTVDPQ